MAWIESHQTLSRHPKTLRLAAELKCGVPAAIGYVHLMWYWALDFAPTGDIRTSPSILAHACEWRGSAERFIQALVTAGFLEDREGGVVIHDWADYAGKLMDRRAANAERTRAYRARHVMLTSEARDGATVPNRTGPNQTVPPNPLSHTDADAQGGSAPRVGSQPTEDDDPVVSLRNGAAICPLCRLPYTGPYLDHTAAKHRVNASPATGNLFGSRRDSIPSAPPPEVEAQFAAMHEHLQSLEHPSA